MLNGNAEEQIVFKVNLENFVRFLFPRCTPLRIFNIANMYFSAICVK